jgi:hypothetical protein
MKTNPILNFRISQNIEEDSTTDRIFVKKKSVEFGNQSTLITKSREAIDSSEITMTHEEMHDSFYIKCK